MRPSRARAGALAATRALDGNVVVWEEHTSEKWRDVLCDELNDTESTEYTKMIQAQMQSLSKDCAVRSSATQTKEQKRTEYPSKSNMDLFNT